MFLRKKTFWIFLFIALASLTYIYKVDALVWYLWHTYQYQPNSNALNLKNYQVEIEGTPIPNLKNASGLTYNENTNTLFTVLNKEGQVVEIDLTGNIIRQIAVNGVEDIEGITHIAGNDYVIADERDNRLIIVNIEDNTTVIDANNAPRLELNMGTRGNKNIEGVSWDDNNQRLLVVKERDPKNVISIKGFVDADVTTPPNIVIKNEITLDSAIKWSLRDLSSVTYHSRTDKLLFLSDESKMIKEYDENGKAIGALALWRGFHGLHHNVPQAEGIAVGNDDRIFIMSEPNLLYVFKPVLN